jgi:hypothetical protein
MNISVYNLYVIYIYIKYNLLNSCNKFITENLLTCQLAKNIPCLSWNLKFDPHTKKYPVYVATPHLFNTNSIIVNICVFLVVSSLQFWEKYCNCHFFSYTCHIRFPLGRPWYHQPNNNYSCRHENSPVKVKRLTHTPAPRLPALLPVLPPRRSFPFSCALSVDRIKCGLFPCGNTAFIGSDLDGTIFVPAIIVNNTTTMNFIVTCFYSSYSYFRSLRPQNYPLHTHSFSSRFSLIMRHQLPL